MKIIVTIGLLIIGFISWRDAASMKCNDQPPPDRVQLDWLQHWLSAWELISDEVFSLPRANPPKMVFFDKDSVYTTSEVTAPRGERFSGPTLFGKPLPWRKAAHNNTLTLPDSKQVPVQITTFAAPLKDKIQESFFVMAAPAFWKEAGIESNEVGFEKMLTGIFLHEFTHTRQMQGLVKKIDELTNQYTFDSLTLNDDVVQDNFSEDSQYEQVFREEVARLYEAAFAKETDSVEQLATEGLTMLKERQKKYFVGEKKVLRELDDVFLSMEGIGQYAMVAWLIHPKGGNVSPEAAVKEARRKRQWWVQEEGLALVLILNRISNPDWSTDMFGHEQNDILQLLEDATQ